MTRVAFIGLGRMGHGMAGRYLDAGFHGSRFGKSQQGQGGKDLIARGRRNGRQSPEDAAIRCRRPS